jgi:3-oxoacyl-[acyl-carrier-protein] synthase-3
LSAQGAFSVNDVDMYIFTQVRRPTIELVMADLGQPMEKTHAIMEEYGYTGSACVGMALDQAIEKRRIRPGNLVVMVGSGVGYNQAGVAFRMPHD